MPYDGARRLRNASPFRGSLIVAHNFMFFCPLTPPPPGATLADRIEEQLPAMKPGALFVPGREEVRYLTEIRLKKGESVDKALRRLKKKIDREGTLREVRNHRHFEKPSERRRRKEKAARFAAMLSARYADL